MASPTKDVVFPSNISCQHVAKERGRKEGGREGGKEGRKVMRREEGRVVRSLALIYSTPPHTCNLSLAISSSAHTLVIDQQF